MNVSVRVSKAFAKQAKSLFKKHKSLWDDLSRLEAELCENPFIGKEMLPNVFKIRLAVKSKGKGKSGGARVISWHETKSDAETEMVGIVEKIDQQHIVHLIAIYDKSETDSIADHEIRDLIIDINNQMMPE